jgi:hypothetical protein
VDLAGIRGFSSLLPVLSGPRRSAVVYKVDVGDKDIRSNPEQFAAYGGRKNFASISKISVMQGVFMCVTDKG